MAQGEIVGGPRDGEQFTIPGDPPPAMIRVLEVPLSEPLTMWHVAARGHLRHHVARVIVCTLDVTVTKAGTYRYRWPVTSR